MARHFKDMTGLRFGHLVVIERAVIEPRTAQCVKWRCRCDCGTVKVARADKLRQGRTLSCGCSHDSLGGLSTTTEYGIWEGMVDRCTKPQTRSYHNYGGRGIKVCARWMDFKNFLTDMGERPLPNMSLDRINNDGDYEPGNCRWATARVQQNNRRDNKMVTHDGVTKTVSQWAQSADIGAGVLHSRLRLGWDMARALSTPVSKRDKYGKAITDRCREWGCHPSTIYQRLHYGWSIERALSEKPQLRGKYRSGRTLPTGTFSVERTNGPQGRGFTSPPAADGACPRSL